MNSSPIDATTVKQNVATIPKRTTNASLIAYRFMIFYRFALALVGGYVLASLSAIFIAEYFIDYRASAAISATLVAFTVHTVAFIWVFMVNKTLKATLGIVVPCLVLFAFIQILGN